jgi:hypothetical protein
MGDSDIFLVHLWKLLFHLCLNLFDIYNILDQISLNIYDAKSLILFLLLI